MELAVYGGLFGAALLVRLAAIGRWPLLEGELGSALAAWRAVQGSADRPDYYVPLLVDANIVLFWLAKASDGATRLLPAVAGAGLTLLPYALRDLLGRVGALAAAMLLAFAPSWVFYSRTSDAPILAAFLGLCFLASVWRYRRTGDPRSARYGAVALGLGLAVGGGVYTALVGLLVVALTAAVAEDGWRSGWRRVWSGSVGMWDGASLALLGGSFFMAATAGLANPGGLGESVAAAGRWVRDLTPVGSGVGPLRYLLVLVLYDPLTLALAVVGAAWAVARRDALLGGLVLWAVVSLLLGTALGHREPFWVLDALLPLVLLAGLGAQRTWALLRRGLSVYDGVAIYCALVLLGFGLLALASYLQVGHEGWRGYALVTAGALVLGWAAYWLWAPHQALRVGAVVVGVLLLGVTVRTGTAVAYQTGRDPRELLLVSPTSVQLRDLETWLGRVATRRHSDRAAYEIGYERTLAPWMEWYLREYPLARPLSGLATDLLPEALITRSGEQASWPTGDFVGQGFRAQETWNWSSPELTWRDRLRWFIYRTPVGQEGSTDLVYWVRLSGGEP